MTILAVAAGALASASTALGAQRYASPTSTDVVGSCSSIAPCRLDRAVNGASAGDEVVVEPGTYNVTYSVSASVPIDLHGVPGQPAPRLIGASNLGGSVVELAGGGSLSYLYVEGNEALESALEVEDALVSGVVVSNAVGEGADLRGSTLLRDSVVGGDTAIETKDGKVAGAPAKILNSSVVAPDGAAAIKAKQSVGPEIIRNSIVRGGDNDVLVYPRASVAVDHSNFRPAFSSGYTDAGANQSGDPLFANVAAGDLHLLAGSPAIDAGSADADLGAVDAGYAYRVAGAAVDLGAYEFGSSPADPATVVNPGGGTYGGGGGSGDGPKLAHPSHPVQGSKMNVAPVTGSVKVRPPGSSTYVPLSDDASVPVNSTIDATRGVVALTSARGGGDTRAQTGRFWGGVFKVVQRRGGDGYTELQLKGGAFGSCKTPGAAKTAVAAGSRAVRQLWGKDRHGRFRTRGRDGQATVRGTEWLTQDRCDGTLFAVRRGAIAVKAKHGGKAVVLHAGQRYVAR